MTERKSMEELAALRHRALSRVVLYGNYRHHKSGGYYCVTDVVLKEAGLIPQVCYAPLTNAGVVFSRPLSEFVTKFAYVPLLPASRT